MLPAKHVAVFADRYPLVGPLFWVVSIQNFIMMAVVAGAWPRAHAYDFWRNTISDLGNTTCGPFGEKFVCSPLHNLMNASFIVLGLTMIAGSLLIYHEFHTSRATLLGFACMALAGAGSVLVGLCAENTLGTVHQIGAGLAFALGNLALIILGLSLDISAAFAVYSVCSGAISLAAALLFSQHIYLGLGPGGMERVAANLQTLWLVVFGLYMSRNHFRYRRLYNPADCRHRPLA